MSALRWLEQFAHPGKTGAGGGYWFWSGIGSGSPLFVAAYVLWRKHNCHVRRCWRIQWRPYGEHALCKKHHPADAPYAKDIA